MSNTAFMCKDCCEVNSEKGLYENCINCGSHRIVEIEAYMYDGELVITGDLNFAAGKKNYNFLRAIVHMDYLDEMLYQKTMGE